MVLSRVAALVGRSRLSLLGKRGRPNQKTQTGPFLTRGRSQRVDEAGGGAAAQVAAAVVVAPGRPPPAAPRLHLVRPHLHLRPLYPVLPENLSHHHSLRQSVRPLRGLVGSLKLPSGARAIEVGRRLLRERNLPPKVVDPESLDQGEVHMQVHVALHLNPNSLRPQPGVSPSHLPNFSRRATRAGVETPTRVLRLHDSMGSRDLLKRKAHEEIENQRSPKVKKTSRKGAKRLPRRINTKRQLRPRR